jgi:hypothetical protein
VQVVKVLFPWALLTGYSVDITPIVWQWSDKFREAEQRDDILHTCRDFDKIRNWAEERSMGDLPDLTLYVEG